MDRVADLRADYDRLGVILATEPNGMKAAAIVRERRLISELLERLEATPGEVPFVDEVAARRRKAGGTRPPVRRRKSG